MRKKKIRIQFKQKELQELLRDFYTITKIRLVVFDDVFQKVAAYPSEHSTYCEILRSDQEAKQACKECDLEGCKICKKKKRMHMYECHAGLVEVVLPLMDGDMVIGYLMLGQIILDDEVEKEEKWAELYPKIKKYNIDMEQLKNCYQAKRRQTKQTLYAAAKIMETCASYLYFTKTVAVKEEDLSKQIDQYMEEHLQEDISTEDLCMVYGLSRTALYELFNHSFGGGIAEHLRELRIRKAKDLLAETDMRISAIAQEVGFEDYNYFTKVFKKSLGFTPRDYRKEVKKMDS